MKLPPKNVRVNCLSVLGIFLLFAFQQFIFYYNLYYLREIHFVIYILIWDFSIVIYILLGLILQKCSSVRYAVVWFMYSVTVVFKMAVFAFNTNDTAAGGFTYESEDTLLTFFGLYVTPVVYSLFNSASKYPLFPDDSVNISVDELLHSDLGLSTTIDLWDVVLMFSHLVKCKKDLLSGLVTRTFVLTFLIMSLINIFLLGLTFPTAEGETSHIFETSAKLMRVTDAHYGRSASKDGPVRRGVDGGSAGANYRAKSGAHSFDKRSADSSGNVDVNPFRSSLDMFTIAKYAFVIGFFLIDLPYLCYRIYLSYHSNVFSPLIYKNVLFLFLRPYRLNMNQMAERDSAKGWQTAFFEAESTNLKMDAEMSADPNEGEYLKKFTRRYTLKQKQTKMAPDVLSEANMERLVTRRSLNRNGSVWFNQRENECMSEANVMNSHYDDPSDHYRDSIMSMRSEGHPEALQTLPTLARMGTMDAHNDHSMDTHNDAPPENDHPGHSFDHSIDICKAFILAILRKNQKLPVKSFPRALVWDYCKRWWERSGSTRRYGIASMANVQTDYSHSLLYRCYSAIFFTVLPRIFIVVLIFSYPGEIRPPRRFIGAKLAETHFVEMLPYYAILLSSFMMPFSFYSTCGVLDLAFSFVRDVFNLLSLITCVCAFKSILPKGYQAIHCLTSIMFLVYPLAIVSDFYWSVWDARNGSEWMATGMGHDDHPTRGRMDSQDDQMNGDHNGHYDGQDDQNGEHPMEHPFSLRSNHSAHPATIHSFSKAFLYRVEFFICKYSISPIAANFRLLSRDLMECIVTMDILIHSQWSHLIYTCIFRLLCCSITSSKVSITIVLIDLLLGLLYTTLSQALRALILRGQEITHIIATSQDKMGDGQRQDNVSLGEVDKYIKVQGLLSSPGIIVPAFL